MNWLQCLYWQKVRNLPLRIWASWATSTTDPLGFKVFIIPHAQYCYSKISDLISLPRKSQGFQPRATCLENKEWTAKFINFHDNDLMLIASIPGLFCPFSSSGFQPKTSSTSSGQGWSVGRVEKCIQRVCLVATEKNQFRHDKISSLGLAKGKVIPQASWRMNCGLQRK